MLDPEAIGDYVVEESEAKAVAELFEQEVEDKVVAEVIYLAHL